MLTIYLALLRIVWCLRSWPMQKSNKKDKQQRNTRTEGGSFVLPEAKLVHGDGEMARLTEALVGVAVVHRDQIHIAEDEALVIIFLQRFRIAHVEQLGSVEDILPMLLQTRGKQTGLNTT